MGFTVLGKRVPYLWNDNKKYILLNTFFPLELVFILLDAFLNDAYHILWISNKKYILLNIFFSLELLFMLDAFLNDAYERIFYRYLSGAESYAQPPLASFFF